MNNDITNSADKRIVDLVGQGKVSDIYAFNGLIFKTSNRLSCFNHVIYEDVPKKGQMLNCISENMKKYILEKNGFYTDRIEVPKYFFRAAGFSEYRNMRYSKELLMLPFEFIVRNYITGSAWKAYSSGEDYCGIHFPSGLKDGSKLPEPVVTPTTKDENDEPISKEQAIKRLAHWFVDNELLVNNEKVRITNDIVLQLAKEFIDEIYRQVLEVFQLISNYCEKRGILFIDSKFEFGLDEHGTLVFADEVGTPDSSRFCSKAEYEELGIISSMDKQIVRNYCKEHGFTGKPGEKIPQIPDEIILQLSDIYVEIATRLFGESIVRRYL